MENRNLPLPSHIKPIAPERGEVGITKMAELYGVSLRTLRFYEEKGLLNPRRDSRHRYYDEFSRSLMACIQSLRDVGVPVADIQAMLAVFEERGDVEAADEAYRDSLRQRIDDIDRQVNMLSSQREQAQDLLYSIEGSSPEPHMERLTA